MLHLCHTAYPTPLERRAECRAELRDERDSERLAACADVIARALDELIPYAAPLEHPNARWGPDDLVQVLSDQAENVRAEQQRLRGPTVIDETDYD